MSYSDQDTAIIGHIDTTWANRGPVQYPNTDLYPPEGTDTPWLRVAIVNAAASKRELGDAGFVRYPGMLILSVFAPQGEGDGELMDLADTLASAFQRKALGAGVRFRDAWVQPVGPDGKWYQVNVNAPFWRDT